VVSDTLISNTLWSKNLWSNRGITTTSRIKIAQGIAVMNSHRNLLHRGTRSLSLR
jgi:hypothetical protein